MTKFIAKGLVWLLAFAAFIYVMDFIVWRVEVAAGGGTASVTVGRMQVAEMKGNKEEFFPDGEEVVTCSESIFPQTGAGACWWVRRHRTIFER